MVRVRFEELDDEVKKFLARAQQGQSVVVEDENGAVRFGVTPYAQAAEGERLAALTALGLLQSRTADSMSRTGVTEEQIDVELRRN
jgi:hypothetical protein